MHKPHQHRQSPNQQHSSNYNKEGPQIKQQYDLHNHTYKKYRNQHYLEIVRDTQNISVQAMNNKNLTVYHNALRQFSVFYRTNIIYK